MVAYNMAAAHVTTKHTQKKWRQMFALYLFHCPVVLYDTQSIHPNSEEIGMDHFSYLPFFSSGFRRVLCCPVTKNHKNRNKKKTVCLQSFSPYSVCVCSSNGKCAVVPMLVHSWRGNTQHRRQIWHISFLFRHSFLILVAHDDASIKKWKAIIPFYKIKKRREREKKIYLSHDNRQRASLSLPVKSVHSTSRLPLSGSIL